jgi:hypothetical protein
VDNPIVNVGDGKEASFMTAPSSYRNKVFIAAAASAIAFTPFAEPVTPTPLAHADGNAANLDQLVAGVYNKVQRGCTPSTPPSFQRIAWDSPPGGQGGSGRIIDANPGLGGPFHAYWNLGGGPFPGAQGVVPAQPQGYWDIVLEFC